MAHQTQREKFEEAARELECDESEERWDRALADIAKAKTEPTEGKADE